MAIKNYDDVISDIQTLFADNSTADISPADLRAVLTTMFDSSKWRSFEVLAVNTVLDAGVHNIVLADDTTGNKAFTLPDNATNSGAMFGVMKITSLQNTVTVSTVGTDTINGQSSVVLEEYGEFVSLIGDGNGSWWIVNRHFDDYEPSQYVSYLPVDTPYTTPTLVPDTPTKILVATTVKYNKDFALEDTGGGNLAWRYKGVKTKEFSAHLTSGIRTSASNTLMKLYVYKNGSPETGLYIPRKVGIGADTGALSLQGAMELSTDDYIEIYAESDSSTTMTFDGTSIFIQEIN